MTIAEVFRDRRFTSGQIVAHAGAELALGDALEAADITSAQELGCVFRRLEGITWQGSAWSGWATGAPASSGRCRFARPKPASSRPLILGIMNTDFPSFTASQLTHARALDYVRALSCQYEGTKPLEELFPERFPLSLSASAFRQKAAVGAGTPSDSHVGRTVDGRAPLTDRVCRARARGGAHGEDSGLAASAVQHQRPRRHEWRHVRLGGGGQAQARRRTRPRDGPTPLRESLRRSGDHRGVDATRVTRRRNAAARRARDRAPRDSSMRSLSIRRWSRSTNVNPASITSAATPIASSGTSAANALTDFKALRAAFTAANPNAAGTVLLASPRNATALAMACNAPMWEDGAPLFGVTVLTSTALGTNLVMLDPSGVLVALDDIEIDASKNASVEMEVPVTDPSTAATVYRSVWQMNLVALKVTAFANWKLARASAVAIVSGAAYV